MQETKPEDPSPDLEDESSPDRLIAGGQLDNRADEAGSQTQVTPLAYSPAYQQKYDSRGYPENPASRATSRQSRRAMNDVLATVGVCVGINTDGHKISMNDRGRPTFDRAKLDAIVRENELGLLVDSADMALLSLASMSTAGLRHRLQVSRLRSTIQLY